MGIEVKLEILENTLFATTLFAKKNSILQTYLVCHSHIMVWIEKRDFLTSFVVIWMAILTLLGNGCLAILWLIGLHLWWVYELNNMAQVWAKSTVKIRQTNACRHFCAELEYIGVTCRLLASWNPSVIIYSRKRYICNVKKINLSWLF